MRIGGVRIDTLVIRISLGQCEPPITKEKKIPGTKCKQWHTCHK